MDYHRPAPHSAGPASLINDTGIPALSALLKPLDNRLFWPAVAIGGLLILAFVLYLQHVRGFAPCSLCIFIRLDVLGLVLAGIVGSLAPRSRIAGGIAALGMLAASLGGIYHAWSLVAEEKLAAQGMGSCKMFMGFPNGYRWIPGCRRSSSPRGCAAKWSDPARPVHGGLVAGAVRVLPAGPGSQAGVRPPHRLTEPISVPAQGTCWPLAGLQSSFQPG